MGNGNTKTLLCCILTVQEGFVLLVLSGILGTRIERNHQKAWELQREHVSTIAVVNMDNGVRE